LCYGELKDLAVPGVRPPAPDPRLPFAVVGSVQSERWRQVLENYWCQIEPGPFWSGDDGGEGEDSNPARRAMAAVGQAVAQVRGERQGLLDRAEIRAPYSVGRYPVTNADYARFLQANGPDGYDLNKPWWTEQGRAYLLPGGYRFDGEPEQLTHPRFWTVARYNGPLQPVVGVSWYEAAAYCRWLTNAGHEAGWLPLGEVIRLPSWHEWERAVRHIDTRRYPWGTNEPNPERANYSKTGLNAPSPIGCFPTGVARCGAQDMVGNVVEWSASPHEHLEMWRKDFTISKQVVISWTSFIHEGRSLGCGARNRYYPIFRSINQGFRVVQSLALSE
jgi:formylglycine-generating enzyme required for sulfatase activity